MNPRLLHVYQNTPTGREALLQTSFFCRMMGAAPVIYLPESPRFLMYFEKKVVQVDLEGFHENREGVREWRSRASDILAEAGLDAHFLEIRHRTTPDLPDVPVDFDYMTCPVSPFPRFPVYSELGMRRLTAVAPFTLLLPSPVAREWKSLVVFYEGSGQGEGVLAAALMMARNADLPLDLFTFGSADSVRDLPFAGAIRHIFSGNKNGKRESLWMNVPHDALAVMGASHRSWLRERFGFTLKKEFRRRMASALLLTGPVAQERYMRIWERRMGS
ncbi:hypothetical protein OOT00_01805 [Desulfobotulus sp. H1]|uniref:Universal stress protein n=1 Tax=Desulfobotulus pelophilus TaxID=2823377 RepID=A0ABT3N5I1_9BACT|nr:hypothetical protein [Desulfobotulus pelophilus]MCW7752718.1 hypothetical protein [Desulfobotulus pelophilus]